MRRACELMISSSRSVHGSEYECAKGVEGNRVNSGAYQVVALILCHSRHAALVSSALDTRNSGRCARTSRSSVVHDLEDTMS